MPASPMMPSGCMLSPWTSYSRRIHLMLLTSGLPTPHSKSVSVCCKSDTHKSYLPSLRMTVKELNSFTHTHTYTHTHILILLSLSSEHSSRRSPDCPSMEYRVTSTLPPTAYVALRLVTHASLTSLCGSSSRVNMWRSPLTTPSLH